MGGIAEYISKILSKIFRKIHWNRDNPFMTFGEVAIKKGTCCICEKKLHDPCAKEGHFSLIPIYKKPTWSSPNAVFVTKTGGSFSYAIAVICAQCQDIFGDNIEGLRKSVQYAVELDQFKRNIVYHPVKELEDYPLIIEV
jgi:hypothetical protein